ncbi:adenylyl-sulfate kinase [Tenggerimyces flavus]|uniref:Adenylyl-sulfate kinase n=1 Tax=Tenggerimyces flavus TaxID=1708749 RepID=A0ABV7Y918_9ACTN|nr:adenylyl-sulfate kinase [Tenggerimyces flavus]MBM7783807.1 sulfate adenylyltransferase [Tenggerimyces flavus]
MTPAEYDDLELALDGILDTVTVVAAESVDSLDVTDLEGTPIARLTVLAKEPLADGRVRLTGSVEALRPREDGVFRTLRRTPADVGGGRIAAVPVDAPLSSTAIEHLAGATAGFDRVLLLPLVGTGSPQGISAHGLVRATLAAAALLPGEVRVVPVPAGRTIEPARVAAAYGEPVHVVSGGPLPDAVETIVQAERRGGLVVFLTGLSGSGKSTIARGLREALLERGRTVTLLDGDVVRRMLSAGLGFSKADREANIRRIGYVAAEVARHGGLAICAPIAPYAATRAEVRAMVEEAGGSFALVHVSTPLEECERRDRKGLYAKARAGEIKEFTGISDPYEAPDDTDLAIDTTSVPIAAAVERVLGLLRDHGWLEDGEGRDPRLPGEGEARDQG